MNLNDNSNAKNNSVLWLFWGLQVTSKSSDLNGLQRFHKISLTTAYKLIPGKSFIQTVN